MKFLKWFLIINVLLALLGWFMHWHFKRSTANTYARYAAKAPYDVIIVPGAPYDSATQSTIVKVRMLWAKNLYDKGIARNIIFSGSAVYSCWIEGMAMKTLADSMGIPAARTFAEIRAEHGNENIYYGYKLAKQLGFKKVALATDQFQSFYLEALIGRRFPDMAFLPVSVDSFAVYSVKSLPAINTLQCRVDSFVPLNLRNNRWERLKKSTNDEVKE